MRISDWSSDVCSSDLYRLAIPQTDSYDRTHPLTGERIAALENLYRASPAWNTPPDPKLDVRYQRIKGKLTGFVEDSAQVMRLYPETEDRKSTRLNSSH